MDRFEAWFDGQDAFAPATTPQRPSIALPRPGATLLRMAAQAQHSFDSVVKRAEKKDPEFYRQLIAQTYRVLLTRGMNGCVVAFTDEETKRFVESRIKP